MFNDLRELKRFASPMGDECRALLRKLPFFNNIRKNVMNHEMEDVIGLEDVDEDTFRENYRQLLFIDFVDESQSEFQKRYAARKPKTKVVDATGWEEYHMDLGVRTRGKLEKGVVIDHAVTRQSANNWDWKEEMHAKGINASPVDMDWEPSEKPSDDASNGMAIGVGLIAAVLILAYS